MVRLPPAQPGMTLGDVDTPALVIDLEAFERNLRRMADATARAGVRLRPHAKTHKSVTIARLQMEHGAVGVCCQKVSEAEILADGGVSDILVSNEVAGAQKIDRLAALAKKIKLGVCVDNVENIAEIATAAEKHDANISVLVEIDVGGNRCGVAPGEPALRLASKIARSNLLRFGGLQAYHGSAQHFRSYDERRDAIARTVEMTRRTVDLLGREGLACDTVGGAGTGTFEFEAGSGIFNEIQAGSYIFMDADYSRNRKLGGDGDDRFEHALFILTTVMSKPDDSRAVVDAGHKSAAVDSGPPEPFEMPGVVYRRPSDEHGVLMSEGGRLPNRGEKILLIPGHCDPTVNLYDWYVCVRGMRHGLQDPEAKVEAIWPVSARGAAQ